tara:strand:+ start:333 stop:578 length:246 start_codon:yes stop_codon:yes gene_type:complete
MANRNFAIVKLDDYDSTASTGGIVERIVYWPENDSDRELEIYNLEKVMGSSNYILVPCNDDCQEGWIYTDKSHQLVDSNKG